MSQIIINGGNKLNGELSVHGAKNSCLPILSACVLCKGETILHNCPKLTDVKVAVSILEKLDCKCKYNGDTLIVNSGNVCACEIPNKLMREMRSSIVFLGAILGRCKEAVLSFPGGCELGARPIDLHLSALKKMSVKIDEKHGNLYCCVDGNIQGANINLSFPSVGATENIILAASLAKGTTIIENAAREPEIIDLANFINQCGGKVTGAGGSTIVIEGVQELNGCEYSIMGDRIVALTYMTCGAITGGEIMLSKCPINDISSGIDALKQTGCTVFTEKDRAYIKAPKKLKAIHKITTMPYPAFPTDAQAPIMALTCLCDGTSVFVENIFDSRYKHAGELRRMGANINVEGKVAIVQGVKELQGTSVQAKELRGGAALVIAGLAATGKTVISGTEFIDRGYENIEKNLRKIGANIYRS